MTFDNDEKMAIALYAIGTRDACDFAEMLGEERFTDQSLIILQEMVTTKTVEPHESINRTLAPFVRCELARRIRVAEVRREAGN